jgi:hypothetical protein
MKLSKEDICERVADTEDKRAGFNKLAKRAEDMWGLKVFKRSTRQAIEQDGQEQVVTPDPYNVVNLALRLVSDKPLIEVPAYELTDDSTSYSDVREKWLHAAWQELHKLQGENLIGNAKWQSFVLGRCAFQVSWIKKMLPEGMRKTRFPIHVRNLSPYNVGIERGPYYVEHAYHKYGTTLAKVLQEYPNARRKKVVADRISSTRNGEDWRREEVVFTDFWYRDKDGKIYNAKMVDDDFIQQPSESSYVDIPIVEAYGDTSMASDPSLKSLSLLFPMDGLWQFKCRNMSMMATGLLWYFWPFIYLTNETGQVVSDLRIRPGGMEQFPPGTNVNVVQIQPNMPLAQSVMNSLESSMQQATFPGVMYGEAPGDLQAGYGVNLLAQAASGRVDQVRRNLEVAIEKVNELMLGMVETFATESEGVTIYGHNAKNNKPFSETLYPSSMEDGFYKNRVTLRPQMPEDDLQRLTLGKTLVDSGLISARTYRDRWLNVELPDDEENRIFLEQAMKSPELMPKTMLAVLSAYSPDKWREYIRGTPLEQLVEQLEQPPMPEPGMEMPPGMPPTPPSQPMGMPPGMPMGLPPGMPPVQPEAPVVGPMGGGIPPEMMGQLTPEMLGVPNMPPELWAQLMQRPLPPADVDLAMMGAPARRI